MSQTTTPISGAMKALRPNVLPLQNGDQLTRTEFERRYEATPGIKKAELIEGIVFMPPPVSLNAHGEPHANLMLWLGTYRTHTPGLRWGDNSSVRLDLDNEPQPDGCLLIAPDRGGLARISTDGYIEGAPELIAEVAASSASYDLHVKMRVYRRNGVREYLVWRTLDGEMDWFVLRDTDYQRLTPDAAGVYRSEVFPGLWLDAPALLRGDLAAVLQILQQGLASPEHTAFANKLSNRS